MSILEQQRYRYMSSKLYQTMRRAHQGISVSGQGRPESEQEQRRVEQQYSRVHQRRVESGSSREAQGRVDQSRVAVDWRSAEWSSVEQTIVEQEQSRVEQSRVEQSRVEQGRVDQSRVEQSRARVAQSSEYSRADSRISAGAESDGDQMRIAWNMNRLEYRVGQGTIDQGTAVDQRRTGPVKY